ncbi:hypothetical protein ALP29_201206 [Pseudomonas syringae pv. avii]|uniref:Uncharacterized protein n=1 Tax=Pseudomonas syringae pv. avii TaxID=663959 RepID=A0A3M5VF32_PSESX|nr:hypothetical protein ALP29_201206 [Pseudomonas syringae pv. avii]
MRRLKQPWLVFVGTAEAAFAMAEEFALHQFGRDSPAVDRHERFVDARPLLVNQPGYQLFATARFAADVDGCLAARQLADLVAQGAHRRRITQQTAVDAVHRLSGGGQAQSTIDQFAEPVEVHRFGHEIEGPGF